MPRPINRKNDMTLRFSFFLRRGLLTPIDRHRGPLQARLGPEGMVYRNGIGVTLIRLDGNFHFGSP